MKAVNAKRWLSPMAIKLFAGILICLAMSASVLEVSDGKLREHANEALKNGDYENAEKQFRELLAKNAHDKEARLGLSFALLKQRMLQDAYDHAARVVLTDPLSARAHALLGSVILASGDFQNSVEEFRTSLSLKDDEALAIAGLGMVDFYENRLEASIKGLRRAVSLDSSEPDYIFDLGQATARNERYKEAADAYERFLVIAPKTDADRRARIRGLIDFLRYLGKQGSLYVAGGANRTSISFESFDNRPIFKIRINGQKEPFRFVLDTGSGMSVVSEITAQRLGLRPVAKGGLARAVGGGGKFEIVYGYISSIEIGEVKVENIPVYIRRFFDDKVPVDGYLGLSAVSKFLTAIDYGERRLSLIKQHPSDIYESWTTVRRDETSTSLDPILQPDSSLEIRLRTTSSGFLSGEVNLDGFDRPLNFIIDTAASCSGFLGKRAGQERTECLFSR